MSAQTRERLDLGNALREALGKEQFTLHYQPQIELSSGRIKGVEALIRWRHPELGPVSPARFIPVAEDSGLILPIGEWALSTACMQLRAWHAAGHQDLRMAVNLSARQFQQQDLPQLVRKVLRESGIPASNLELELTESVLMGNSDAAVDALTQLKIIGVDLSLDDFGTGYSRLSYLKRFPIDIIKIDQSFTADLPHSVDAASICNAIIAMARSLGLRTVAEGVETEDQRRFLSQNGCDDAQGYYFSRALPAEELVRLLDHQRSRVAPPLACAAA
jgi:EAL domain-containing protein (putative c-di-GMP-specific phosphodiesterase class I)